MSEMAVRDEHVHPSMAIRSIAYGIFKSLTDQQTLIDPALR